MMATGATGGNGHGNGSMIPIASAATVILLLLQAISWLAWSITNSSLEHIDKRIGLVESQFLRIREHDEFTRRLDTQVGKIEVRLTATATRDEVDQRLGINSASIIQLRNDIAELKRDLGQTYPLKEVMGNIQSRIDRIEQWTRAPAPHQQVK